MAAKPRWDSAQIRDKDPALSVLTRLFYALLNQFKGDLTDFEGSTLGGVLFSPNYSACRNPWDVFGLSEVSQGGCCEAERKGLRGVRDGGRARWWLAVVVISNESSLDQLRPPPSVFFLTRWFETRNQAPCSQPVVAIT